MDPTEDRIQATLVRGTDGRLFLVTKNDPPIPLKLPMELVEPIITKAEKLLSEELSKLASEHGNDNKGQTHYMHVYFPTVVPKD